MRLLRTTAAFGAAVLLLVASAAQAALADDPAGVLRGAVERTAAAKTGRMSVVQRATTGGRTLESTAQGVLAGGDSDLVVSGEGGKTRRVSVGTAVRERTPDSPGAPWRQRTRPAPTQTTPFAVARLRDGTSIGDPRLYRSVADAGTERLPQGEARKLVGELDMAALAAAMQLGASDRARMAQWRATLTFWVAVDGTVARNALAIVMPSATGHPTTLDVTIDLSDLDAPLTVTLP